MQSPVAPSGQSGGACAAAKVASSKAATAEAVDVYVGSMELERTYE